MAFDPQKAKKAGAEGDDWPEIVMIHMDYLPVNQQVAMENYPFIDVFTHIKVENYVVP